MAHSGIVAAPAFGETAVMVSPFSSSGVRRGPAASVRRCHVSRVGNGELPDGVRRGRGRVLGRLSMVPCCRTPCRGGRSAGTRARGITRAWGTSRKNALDMLALRRCCIAAWTTQQSAESRAKRQRCRRVSGPAGGPRAPRREIRRGPQRRRPRVARGGVPARSPPGRWTCRGPSRRRCAAPPLPGRSRRCS
jgi:hypothetical protein